MLSDNSGYSGEIQGQVSSGSLSILNTGGLQAQNCTSQAYNTTLTNYPYYGYQYQPVYYSYTTPADVEIRLVANGFVIKHKSIEYVFSDAKELSAWLTKEFQPKKK